MLDTRPQFEAIRFEVMEAIERVVASQRFILGEDVEAFERQVAAYCGTRFAIGCASGSDALMLALMACGVGPGDEVLTVAYTFFATGGAIHRLGAKPVYIDIDPATFNVDCPQAIRVMSTRPIKAVIPVHLFGGCADMDSVCTAAAERGIPVIEDAAQAIGAEYKQRRAGSMGHIGCFSFYPSKNLGAFGDAGVCTTNDDGIADTLRALRVHGSRQKYLHEVVGVNSRIDALQAAILAVKLKYLDDWSAKRQQNADAYRELFTAAGIPVLLPEPAPYQTRHIYNQFVIRAGRRDELRSYLNGRGIETEVYYPLPLHLQPCFAYLGYERGSLPVSEQIAASSLALPIFPELEREDLAFVVRQIGEFYVDKS
jgi:dTDP-4-amino-4,6-dideoxygalactose transaminase